MRYRGQILLEINILIFFTFRGKKNKCCFINLLKSARMGQFGNVLS